MVTIHRLPDCGNAPRRELLAALVVALAKHDADHVDLVLADDFAWRIPGQRILEDRDGVRQWIAATPPVEEVSFGSLLTHGRGASVDGVLVLQDGTRQAFCHVLRFAGAAKTAKVLEVDSYLIALPAPG